MANARPLAADVQPRAGLASRERAAAASPSRARDGLWRYVALIGLGVFVTTIGQPIAIGKLPIQFLLKNRLHVGAEAMAGFFALGALAWYLKPMAGLLSDSLPILGTRRRHYLLISTAAAAGLWLAMGLVPKTYSSLLWTVVALNIFMVMASTVVGGLLVEEGQRHGATGRLSSLRLSLINLTGLIVGPLGGYLAERAFGLTTVTAAGLFAVLLVCVFFLLKETSNSERNTQVLQDARRQLRMLFRSRTLWSAAGLLFLVYIAPGFSTPLFYYQTNTLRFSPHFIGNLGMIGGGMGIAGAALYGVACGRLRLRLLLALGILFNVSSTLFYLGYRSHEAAMLVEGANGLFATLAVIPLFDLAARATPRGSEGLGYALMMSVMNIAQALSDIFGSWLFQTWHVGFMHLVWLNAATTALVLLAVPFLPAVLMNRHDGEVRAGTDA